jgi:5-methylcytosine-specific restriction endonuclease McrA
MALKRYLQILEKIRLERGCFCECCGEPAKHGHHIIPVSETRIHSELVYEPANIIILCDYCHALMHPLIRNVSDWKKARKQRGQTLIRRI